MVTFLITNFTDGIREKELKSSAARAHSARISHQRKRIQNAKNEKQHYAAHLAQLGPLLPLHRSNTFDGEISEQTISEADITQCLLVKSLLQSHVYSDGLRTDSFNVMPGGKKHWPIIDHWTQITIPSNQLVHEVVGVANVYTNYFLDLLQHELLFDAAMAMIIPTLPRGRHKDFSDSEMLQYRGKALNKLMKTISSTDSTEAVATDVVLIVLAYLCTLERRLGDMKAFDLHAKTLQRLVAARGGLDVLGHGGLVKARLLQWDTCWGFTTTKSLFPEARHPYKPIYPAPSCVVASDMYMALPMGFVRLAAEGSLPFDVLELLVKVNRKWKSQQKTSCITGVRNLPAHQPYSDFRDAIPCLGAPDTDKPCFEKLVCIAVLLFCSNGFSSDRSLTNLASCCRTKLSADLPRLTLDNLSEAKRACVFWITIVGIDAWKAPVIPMALLPAGKRMLTDLKLTMRSKPCIIAQQRVLQSFFHNTCLLEVLDDLARVD
ncbi:hypothetical protein H2198_004821 [Neophaeococcomyces mojaviensis]|uniref:Uncharacterized protein n=1 Tax=Neophaeococcomyces mojaviensis TaxID=3383035 RepID=A0ACC3A7U4_9EURO|nr:hypothetical protein H2198_004821 [Knufia sp. JES_112]